MNDSTSSRRVVAAVFGALLLVLAAALFLWPRIEEARSPHPRAAYVAIQPVGSAAAVVGTVEALPGSAFELHAVLEAEMPDGSVAFLTDAPALVIDGQQIDVASIRPLVLNKTHKILWFTVEGSLPYLKLEPTSDAKADLERFRFQEFLHPEWGLSSSLRGSIESHYEPRMTEDTGTVRGFGTQRFQIWVEIFASEDATIPELRLKSPGPERVEELGKRFPTIVLAEPGPLGAAQRVFGLTQVESPTESERLERISAMADERLLFTRATVLRDMLRVARESYDSLDWKLVDFGENSFTDGRPEPGDLLRSGARFVVLLADSGLAGILDGADLCLDFEDGAAIRSLDQVFFGEGGSVDWAALSVLEERDIPNENQDRPQ